MILGTGILARLFLEMHLASFTYLLLAHFQSPSYFGYPLSCIEATKVTSRLLKGGVKQAFKKGH